MTRSLDRLHADRRVLAAFFVGFAAFSLSGCVETLGMGEAFRSVARAPDIPVSIVRMEGGDEAFRTRFQVALGEAARTRNVSLVGADGGPRYLLQINLAVGPGQDGKPALIWVYDIYDATKRRARRLEGSVPLSAAALETADAGTVRKAADESMNEVAAFLIDSAKSEPSQPVKPPVASNE